MAELAETASLMVSPIVETSPEATDWAKSMAGKERKYLTFSLAKEEYGITILKIRDIIGMMPITSAPQTPDLSRIDPPAGQGDSNDGS